MIGYIAALGLLVLFMGIIATLDLNKVPDGAKEIKDIFDDIEKCIEEANNEQ